jgi:hypothetical protein
VEYWGLCTHFVLVFVGEWSGVGDYCLMSSEPFFSQLHHGKNKLHFNEIMMNYDQKN